MNRILPMIPAFVWLNVVTLLSTRANIPAPSFDLLAGDKLGHAAAYALLSWLILWGLQRGRALRTVHFVATFLFATGFGVLMEFVQYAFFPGRFYEVDDMLANAIGAGLACLFFTQTLRYAWR